MAFLDLTKVTDAQKKLLAALQIELQKASVEKTVTIAYSGGLDSRFLAFCAQNFGFHVRLLHVAGNHIAQEESSQAIDFARQMHLTCEVVQLNLPTPQELAAAQKKRCYVCKKAIFSQLKELAVGGKLCDGSNLSDTLVFRPGAQALKELEIYSPLQAAGLTKNDIRTIGKCLGFQAPDQAARPCLLTRFDYGVEPTEDKLKVIAQVESWMDTHPQTRGLRVRLRYPDGNQPELHIEKASLLNVDSVQLDQVQAKLIEMFPEALRELKIRVLDQLSGFYDQKANSH